MNDTLTTPILLIGFNRPETTCVVFEYIRHAQPQKLYVALDGAREDKLYEDIVCKEVQKIVENVDWPCETHYKYNETNRGAEITVSSAISWVFETEEYAIILEDDIIAPISFLKYAQEMLLLYLDNNDLYMISGGQFTPIQSKNDYFFGFYGHTGCGWATWKRAWKDFSLYINDFDSVLSSNLIKTNTNSKIEKKYWIKRIKNMKNRGSGNNTWDSCWQYLLFKKQKLSIIPKRNLTSNIGLFGLHSKGLTENHYRKFDVNFTIKNHPDKVKRNKEYDIYHFNNYIFKNTPLLIRFIRKILSFLK